MNDVEHFDPTFIYRPGHLQKVPDALSRLPGLVEEGDPADTERLFNTELEHSKSIFDTSKLVVPRKCEFYTNLRARMVPNG
jgi:hypothetical protein